MSNLKHGNHRRWGDKEDQTLVELAKKYTVAEIGRIMPFGESCIRTALKRLGIHARRGYHAVNGANIDSFGAEFQQYINGKW